MQAGPMFWLYYFEAFRSLLIFDINFKTNSDLKIYKLLVLVIKIRSG